MNSGEEATDGKGTVFDYDATEAAHQEINLVVDASTNPSSLKTEVNDDVAIAELVSIMDETEESLRKNESPLISLIDPDQLNNAKDAQEIKIEVKPAPPRIINLPNARSGDPYEVTLDLEGYERLVDSKVEHVDGLHFSTETLIVRGRPTTSGEFKVFLTVIIDGQRQTIEARVTVIPDPKSLWKDLPSDPNGKFAKSDEACDAVRGQLFMVGASKRGRSHAHVGSYRDDDFGLKFVESSGWHIGIAADGGGSSKYSRRASQKVVAHIIQQLPKLLEETFTGDFNDFVKGVNSGKPDSQLLAKNRLYNTILTVSFTAAKMLQDTVTDLQSAKEKSSDGQQLEYSIKDFNTTLIICVAKKSKHGWFIGTFSIGDGGAVVVDFKKRIAKLMTTGDSGEFAGQTRFLSTMEFSPEANPSARLHHYVSDSFDSIVLMTDGITDPFFPTDVELQDFNLWSNFWNDELGSVVNLNTNSNETQIELLRWLDFWSAGNHDDRSIVLLRNTGDR